MRASVVAYGVWVCECVRVVFACVHSMWPVEESVNVKSDDRHQGLFGYLPSSASFYFFFMVRWFSQRNTIIKYTNAANMWLWSVWQRWARVRARSSSSASAFRPLPHSHAHIKSFSPCPICFCLPSRLWQSRSDCASAHARPHRTAQRSELRYLLSSGKRQVCANGLACMSDLKRSRIERQTEYVISRWSRWAVCKNSRGCYSFFTLSSLLSYSHSSCAPFFVSKSLTNAIWLNVIKMCKLYIYRIQ